MPRSAKLFGLFAVLLSLSLPACEGKGAPGGPFSPEEFSTEVSEGAASSLATTCADYCSHQSECGASDAACADDCVHSDIAQQYAAAPDASGTPDIADEPVPEACADAYVDAVDCLATPACDQMQIACETEVAAYVDCKLDALAQ